MAGKQQSAGDNFADEFLHHYLKNGIGAMSKTDVDALVMHLLDKYSHANGVPLQQYSNQVVSQTLRAPATKIKKLRYDAGLKYGGRVEDEARRRFIHGLGKAALELDGNRVVLIIEDALAKNWIQDQIKENGIVFDGSFNSEILRINPGDFFRVLEVLLDADAVRAFRDKFDALAAKKRGEDLRAGFAALITSFASNAAKKFGSHAIGNLIGLPDIG